MPGLNHYARDDTKSSGRDGPREGKGSDSRHILCYIQPDWMDVRYAPTAVSQAVNQGAL